MLTAIGPTAAWRHGGIGVGRGPTIVSSPNGLRDWLSFRGESLLWEADGIEQAARDLEEFLRFERVRFGVALGAVHPQ